MKKVIKIDGMGCNHCVESVKKALSEVDNIEVLEVTVGEAIVEIEENFDFSKIVELIDDIGFEVI